jgi:DNA primase
VELPLGQTSKVIIAADGDEASRQAAIESVQALGNNAQIIYPTQGKDFNDMFKIVGRDNLKKYVQASIKGAKGDHL